MHMYGRWTQRSDVQAHVRATLCVLHGSGISMLAVELRVVWLGYSLPPETPCCAVFGLLFCIQGSVDKTISPKPPPPNLPPFSKML